MQQQQQELQKRNTEQQQEMLQLQAERDGMRLIADAYKVFFFVTVAYTPEAPAVYAAASACRLRLGCSTCFLLAKFTDLALWFSAAEAA